MIVLVGADENCVGSCSLAAAAAWAMSQSGQIVHLKLEPGDHELDAPLRFDASSNAPRMHTPMRVSATPLRMSTTTPLL